MLRSCLPLMFVVICQAADCITADLQGTNLCSELRSRIFRNTGEKFLNGAAYVIVGKERNKEREEEIDNSRILHKWKML